MNPDTGRPPKRPRASVQDGIENTGENPSLPHSGECVCRGNADPAFINRLEELMQKVEVASEQSADVAAKVVAMFYNIISTIHNILDTVQKIADAHISEKSKTEGETGQGVGVEEGRDGTVEGMIEVVSQVHDESEQGKAGDISGEEGETADVSFSANVHA